MSTDYAEKEREFLETLEADTGRSLAAWMEAIAAQNLANKNETIDWLRQQGFMFSKASWLERIHENGGRPIYGHVPASIDVPLRIEPITPQAAVTPPVAAPPRQSSLTLGPKTEPVPSAEDPLEELLAKAKALRPLAKHILREITKAVPAAAFTPVANHVSIAHTREFAVLTIGPKELKLGLALPAEPHAPHFQVTKFPAPAYRISPGITHMAALSDVRQIDTALIAAIARAAALAGE